MTPEEKLERKRNLANLGAALLGSAAGGARYGLDKNKKAISAGLRMARAGVTGAGIAGLGVLLNNKVFHRAKVLTEKGQVTKMSSNNYFDNTGLQEFLKVASITMGDEAYTVPTKYAYNAYLVYNSLPEENVEDVTVSLYNKVCPGMDKVAMKLVAANVYADTHPEKVASLLGMAGKTAIHGMSAMNVKSKAETKLNNANQQHKVPNPGFN